MLIICFKTTFSFIYLLIFECLAKTMPHPVLPNLTLFFRLFPVKERTFRIDSVETEKGQGGAHDLEHKEQKSGQQKPVLLQSDADILI